MNEVKEIALTPEQEAFIQACGNTRDGILLDSVAGSGKTFTMVRGVHAIVENFPLASVLALAFNKRIVEELAVKMPAMVHCKTMNAIGHRAWANKLAQTGIRINLNTKKNWDCINEELQKRFPNNRADWKLPEGAAGTARLIALAKTNGIVPDSDNDDLAIWEHLIDYFDLDIEPEFDTFAISVARNCLSASIDRAMAGEIDFDDQLYMPVMFGGFWPKYDVVLIDEAQDISSLQHLILHAVLKENGRLIAVGDPHQAIYGFRGADHNSMESLRREFDLKTMHLTYTFRCPKRVVELAQKLVPHIKAAPEAKSGDVLHLERWTADSVPTDAAIICRNTAPLIDLAFRMIRRGKSCYVLGRDIGQSMISLINRMKARDVDDLLEKIKQWERREAAKFMRLGKEERAEATHDKAASIVAVIEFAFDKLPNDPSVNDVRDLVRSLFGEPGDRANIPTLMTGHKSKGLEYRVVYFLDSHLLPSKYAVQPHALQQEYNLQYVIETRALESLRFVTSKQFERRSDDD